MNTVSSFTLPKSVLDEIFDDEVVVVNLSSGAYFSLRGAALELWSLLRAGASQAELATSLGERFPGKDVEHDVEVWLEGLRMEGLLAGASASQALGDDGAGDGEIAALLRPTVLAGTMEKFTDVEGMLMLDPIHEVDDAGWPKPATDRST